MYNLSTLDKNQLTTITDPLKQKSSRFISLKLNSNKLQALGEGSSAVAEFQEFLEFHNKDKGFLDNLPFIGKVLKNNRYAKYTIEDAVDKFAEHIKLIKAAVDQTMLWLSSEEESAYKMLEEFKVELEKLKTTVELNENNSHSRINQLEAQGIKSPEDTRELRKLKQNLSILKGEYIAIETAYNAMEAKLALLNSSIESTIRIQGKAAQAMSLPLVLKVALETIQTNATLQSAIGGLRDTESVVKALMSDAVMSTNQTSAEAQKLQQQAMQFKECIASLNEIKNDCEDITFKLS
jgi:hypothetical protein